MLPDTSIMKAVSITTGHSQQEKKQKFIYLKNNFIYLILGRTRGKGVDPTLPP